MMAKDSPTTEAIAALQKRGVHFVVCENAMRSFNIKTADLPPVVEYVPSGIVELIRKQESGWAYVKVGR